MCRDWNGSMKGNVCRFLLSQGFVSAYEGNGSMKGNVCTGKLYHKYILYTQCISEFQSKVTENIYALPFPRVDLSSVTCTHFSETLIKLKLIGPPFNVFTVEEIKDFWDHMDSNGDGVIDMSDFSIFVPPVDPHGHSYRCKLNPAACSPAQIDTLKVKDLPDELRSGYASLVSAIVNNDPRQALESFRMKMLEECGIVGNACCPLMIDCNYMM
ncbi:hypothetical protein POM88_001019 [Heracleum sosnowskyi]|uniref:EF-hand domain-containing protein n=1 Tax=Heracleum sosnowskyi TaxID=360622 RepID=A0AAD8JD93_9APIA|nr:hypothetical protein POM88_001019 [Heracleum sosnowskyi]